MGEGLGGGGGGHYVGLGTDRQTDLTLPPSAVPSSRSALRPQPSCSAHPPTAGFFSSVWLLRRTNDAMEGG